MINLDGTGLEQVTFNDTFDGFPMFSPDGKKLVFGSNRNGKTEGETNVFIADWVEVKRLHRRSANDSETQERRYFLKSPLCSSGPLW